MIMQSIFSRSIIGIITCLEVGVCGAVNHWNKEVCVPLGRQEECTVDTLKALESMFLSGGILGVVDFPFVGF